GRELAGRGPPALEPRRVDPAVEDLAELLAGPRALVIPRGQLPDLLVHEAPGPVGHPGRVAIAHVVAAIAGVIPLTAEDVETPHADSRARVREARVGAVRVAARRVRSALRVADLVHE